MINPSLKKLLVGLRLPEAHPVPSELVCFDAVMPSPSLNLPETSSSIVAVDLDDTLLLSNWTCGNFFESACADTVVGSIRYDQMRRTFKGRLQRLRGFPPPFQYDLERYPFLKSPAVFVQFRSGFVAGLVGLKEQGAQLVLVTASARERVDFLFARFPVLRALFGERVVCAEQMAEMVLEIDRQTDDELRSASLLEDACFAASVKAHRLRPRSLAMKTPLAVELALGIPGYDVLLDDSPVTMDFFGQAGLGARLLPVGVHDFSEAYSATVLSEVSRRVGVDETSLVIHPFPKVRLEDPYYYPLLHKHDQLPEVVDG